MTWLLTRQLVCDNCSRLSARIQDYSRLPGAALTRDRLTKLGWRRVWRRGLTRDYCPSCVADIKARTGR
jgi:hypothetical protein